MTVRKRLFAGLEIDLPVPSGYRYLFYALLALLVAYPVMSGAERVSPWVDAIVYVVLVVGVIAVAASVRQMVVAAALGLATFSCLHALEYAALDWLFVCGYTSGIAFFVYLAALLLRDIFVCRDQVTGELIYGALAVYLLIGVGFAFAYQLFDHVDPAAFENVGLLAGDTTESFEGFLYFSFVTMTTLGFGDISPKTPEAGAFVTAQAIVGQMYLAVLVARLVGLQITHQSEGAGS